MQRILLSTRWRTLPHTQGQKNAPPQKKKRTLRYRENAENAEGLLAPLAKIALFFCLGASRGSYSVRANYSALEVARKCFDTDHGEKCVEGFFAKVVCGRCKEVVLSAIRARILFPVSGSGIPLLNP